MKTRGQEILTEQKATIQSAVEGIKTGVKTYQEEGGLPHIRQIFCLRCAMLSRGLASWGGAGCMGVSGERINGKKTNECALWQAGAASESIPPAGGGGCPCEACGFSSATGRA